MTKFPHGLSSFGIPVMGNYGIPMIPGGGKYVFVNGTTGLGSDDNNGVEPGKPVATVQKGVDLAASGDVVLVYPKKISDFTGDPNSYAETVIIPATKPHLSLIGVSHGLTQGGLPQIRKGSGSTALLTVRAAGCFIANLGLNGASATGGGILLDDDNSAKTAFGTTIVGCHFKNCKGSTATNAATGGAINWAAVGNAWQVRISGNRFYKNVGDIVLLGTSNTVPQDVIIEGNDFSGPAASVDCNLYLMGGSGMNGVIIRDNYFPDLPAVGSGTNVRFIKATGCVGLLANNFFGQLTAATGSPVTFAAAGTGAFIPTTMWMAGNYGETTTAGESGEIIRT